MLGFTTVTFRKLKFPEIAEIARLSKSEAIEVGTDVHAKNTEETYKIAGICREKNIKVSSLGSYFKVGKDNPEDFLWFCGLARILGAETIRVWIGTKGSEYYTDSEREALKRDTLHIAETAKGYGLKIAFEFHKNSYSDNPDRLVKFIQDCNTDNIKTYWQPFYQGREKDLYNLKTVFPYLENVHMFYWSRIGYKYPLRRGGRYLKEFFDFLKENGFKGNIYLEFVKGDSVKRFYKDMEFLKEVTRNRE